MQTRQNKNHAIPAGCFEYEMKQPYIYSLTTQANHNIKGTKNLGACESHSKGEGRGERRNIKTQPDQQATI